MAFIFDEVWVNNGQLMMAGANDKRATAVDKPDGTKILHSAFIKGPVQIGDRDSHLSGPTATIMIGRDTNPSSPQSDKSVLCKGNVMIRGDNGNEYGLDVSGGSKYPLYVGGNAIFDHPNIGDLSSRFNTADGKPKPFDIKHPSKEGYRLRHACIEGPEVGVYYRGRLKNQKKIKLPSYWKDLVHTESITVQLQPIGAHQDIIVKRWDDEFVYLQAQGGLPINCFYHVYAERKDINPLITEYEGDSWNDYPDPNYKPDAVNPRYDDPNFSGPPNTITS